MLLRAFMTVKRLMKDTQTVEAIIYTIDNLLQIIEKYNCLPLQPESEVYTVDFCHGAPGVIPMLCTAAELFP
jgi:hypothetical protein